MLNCRGSGCLSEELQGRDLSQARQRPVAILETEARLAAAALGLDPGLGVLHLDSRTRDSLACDLMEPVRPMVDAFLFDWLSKGPLKREWFFEERDGNCRLMGPF